MPWIYWLLNERAVMLSAAYVTLSVVAVLWLCYGMYRLIRRVP